MVCWPWLLMRVAKRSLNRSTSAGLLLSCNTNLFNESTPAGDNPCRKLSVTIKYNSRAGNASSASKLNMLSKLLASNNLAT